MKQSIQERMNRQINLTTKYNQLFDLIVTTAETSLDATATNPADNQYNVTLEALDVSIICNDNEYNTVNVYLYNRASQEGNMLGNLTININGDIDETLHNVPRTLRRTINDFIDDIYDAIDGWIDELENGNGGNGDE